MGADSPATKNDYRPPTHVRFGSSADFDGTYVHVRYGPVGDIPGFAWNKLK